MAGNSESTTNKRCLKQLPTKPEILHHLPGWSSGMILACKSSTHQLYPHNQDTNYLSAGCLIALDWQQFNLREVPRSNRGSGPYLLFFFSFFLL